MSKNHKALKRGLCQEVTLSTSPNTFPKKCGYHSMSAVVYALQQLTFDRDDADPIDAFTYATILRHTSNLGNTAQDFILNNAQVYLDIYEELFYEAKGVEYMYTLAYKQLFTLMCYNEHFGHPYNMPKVLSRQLITIKEHLQPHFKEYRASLTDYDIDYYHT